MTTRSKVELFEQIRKAHDRHGNWATPAASGLWSRSSSFTAACREMHCSPDLRAALAVGSVDPEVVVIEARKVAERSVAAVVPIGALDRYDRPKPTLDGYDTLLEASS